MAKIKQSFTLKNRASWFRSAGLFFISLNFSIIYLFIYARVKHNETYSSQTDNTEFEMKNFSN